MRQIPNALKRLLIVSIVVTTLAIGAPNSSNVSSVCAADSIALTIEEADSLITLFDDQTLEIRLLKIDNRKLQRIAEIDSAMAAEILRLQREHYERMLEVYKRDREHWIIKSLKSPALWFIIGAYAGLRVSQLP
jgi:hypothetical protein